jgi:Tol biopolymer transport system component
MSFSRFGFSLTVVFLSAGCVSDQLKGTIAFQSNRDGNFEIYTMSPDGGNQRRLTKSPSNDISPCWSPGGSTIAFASDRDGNWEIYTVLPDGSDLRRLTHGEGSNTAPAWSRDGSFLLFISTRDAIQGEVYRMKPDGTGTERITTHPSVKDSPLPTRDENTILVTLNTGGRQRIAAYSISRGTFLDLTPAGCNSLNPKLSPDGSKILFVSDMDGTVNLYSMPVGGGAAEQLTWGHSMLSSGSWTSTPGNLLVARNYAIYRYSVEKKAETLLTSKGDGSPDWTSHSQSFHPLP